MQAWVEHWSYYGNFMSSFDHLYIKFHSLLTLGIHHTWPWYNTNIYETFELFAVLKAMKLYM